MPAQSLRHQVVLVVDVPGMPVDLARFQVSANDFQVHGPDVHGPRFVLNEFEGAASPAPPAIGLDQVKLVDESISAKELEAVAQGQNNVADRSCLVRDQPGASQGGFA